MNDVHDAGGRPNESRTFSYVMTGQMFVGDDDLLKIEAKKQRDESGHTYYDMRRVEDELRRDFASLRIVERRDAEGVLYITGKPKYEYEQD